MNVLCLARRFGRLVLDLLTRLLRPRCLLKASAVGGVTALVIFTANCFSAKVVDQFEFENARFEPVWPPDNTSAKKHAKGYWLRSGDPIFAVWDTFETHKTEEGEMCSFTDNSSTEECRICDLCIPQNSQPEGCRFGAATPLSILKIARADGFSDDSSNWTAISNFGGTVGEIQNSCSSSNGPFRIDVEQEGTYGIRQDPEPSETVPKKVNVLGEAKGEAKVHVVPAGQSRTVAYNLTRISSVEDMAAHDFWIWSMSGGEFLNENFSPNLRITDVKIFVGTCIDGATDCPTNAIAVKPSKIIFIKNFDPTIQVEGYDLGEMKCHSGPTNNNGSFINLLQCIKNAADTQTNTPPGPIVMKELVPTYEHLYSADSYEKLTWLVRFNTSDPGTEADADLSTPGYQAMDMNTKLIIQFTIEAKP